jgi:hypothetical protein
MKLTGKVVKIESASQFADKQQRILIRFKEAENGLYDSLRVTNSSNYQIDDEVEMELSLAMPPSIEEYVARIPFSLKDASKEVF